MSVRGLDDAPRPGAVDPRLAVARSVSRRLATRLDGLLTTSAATFYGVAEGGVVVAAAVGATSSPERGRPAAAAAMSARGRSSGVRYGGDVDGGVNVRVGKSGGGGDGDGGDIQVGVGVVSSSIGGGRAACRARGGIRVGDIGSGETVYLKGEARAPCARRRAKCLRVMPVCPCYRQSQGEPGVNVVTGAVVLGSFKECLAADDGLSLRTGGPQGLCPRSEGGGAGGHRSVALFAHLGEAGDLGGRFWRARDVHDGGIF